MNSELHHGLELFDPFLGLAPLDLPVGHGSVLGVSQVVKRFVR